MKKNITEKEYQKILKRIAYIEEEIEKIKKNYQLIINNYQFIPKKDFIGLIIIIKRENRNIDFQIKQEKIKFLENLNISEKIYPLLEEKIDYLIELLQKNNTNLLTQNETEFTPIIKNYKSFQGFYEKTKNLINKKESNNHLINYIESLDREHQSLLQQKNAYEKKLSQTFFTKIKGLKN